jgi:5-methylcytosine-specific restriction protein A
VDGKHWAGWLRTEQIVEAAEKDFRLQPMLDEPAGKIVFSTPLALDASSLDNPFRLNSFGQEETDKDLDPAEKPARKTYGKKPNKSEEELAEDLFKDDAPSEAAEKTLKVIETFKRNQKAVRDLKRLYKTCQITGDDFIFSKVNGEPYLEVHHLVPLGEGGADDPTNLVVISAHIHRMLHYADVEGIDLTQIEDNELGFTINGESFTITWRPEHAKIIADAGGATV